MATALDSATSVGPTHLHGQPRRKRNRSTGSRLSLSNTMTPFAAPGMDPLERRPSLPPCLRTADRHPPIRTTIRWITNSPSFIGAMPTSATRRSSSISLRVIVVGSHRTKNTCSAFTRLGERGHAAAALLRHSSDIDVVRAALFQREADEFTAALDLGPVVELVAHWRIVSCPRFGGSAGHSHRLRASPNAVRLPAHQSAAASTYARPPQRYRPTVQSIKGTQLIELIPFILALTLGERSVATIILRAAKRRERGSQFVDVDRFHQMRGESRLLGPAPIFLLSPIRSARRAAPRSTRRDCASGA